MVQKPGPIPKASPVELGACAVEAHPPNGYPATAEEIGLLAILRNRWLQPRCDWRILLSSPCRHPVTETHLLADDEGSPHQRRSRGCVVRHPTNAIVQQNLWQAGLSIQSKWFATNSHP